MKKLSNKILIITLLILVAVFILSRLFRAPGLESNLRKSLLQLDTARVTEVRIKPASHPEEDVTLHRDGNRWKVIRGKQQAETDEGLVRSMIGVLSRIQPLRMVSRKKEKWEEFKVGEKGTHISVYENSEQKADFVVGKTGFTPSSEGRFGGGFTYVRLTDEQDVYAVEGFLESGFDRSYNDWRNKEFLRLKKDEITKIIFQYPADSGFVAEKKDSVWFVAQVGADAKAMEGYLARLSTQNLTGFDDGFVRPGNPDVTIQVESKAGSLARVEGWRNGTGWVLNSSWQKDVYFSGSVIGVIQDLLIGKKKLLGASEKQAPHRRGN